MHPRGGGAELIFGFNRQVDCKRHSSHLGQFAVDCLSLATRIGEKAAQSLDKSLPPADELFESVVLAFDSFAVLLDSLRCRNQVDDRQTP